MARRTRRKPARRVQGRRAQDKSFWAKVFQLCFNTYASRQAGKWVITIDNVSEPRRFMTWKAMHDALVRLAPNTREGADIVCYRTNDKPSLWECFKWSWLTTQRNRNRRTQ